MISRSESHFGPEEKGTQQTQVNIAGQTEIWRENGERRGEREGWRREMVDVEIDMLGPECVMRDKERAMSTPHRGVCPEEFLEYHFTSLANVLTNVLRPEQSTQEAAITSLSIILTYLLPPEQSTWGTAIRPPTPGDFLIYAVLPLKSRNLFTLFPSIAPRHRAHPPTCLSNVHCHWIMPATPQPHSLKRNAKASQ